MKHLKILILDDDQLCVEKYTKILRDQGSHVLSINHPTVALEILKTTPVDILLCDIILPDKNGLDMLNKVKENYPEMDVIMVSGQQNLDIVVDAFRIGAIDYIVKPLTANQLISSIKRTQAYNRSLKKIKFETSHKNSLIPLELAVKMNKEFIGVSEEMKELSAMALRVGKERHINVLITGENGTGKEIVAQVIHYSSPRQNEAFYPINSAAIPDSLVESEFFGHKKGTFTGATENKKGCFEMAHKGTLFLDEISEMPLHIQAKLLRAIEEKRIKPIGSNKELDVDFRIISATNSKPDELIEKRKLRIDLFHRLNTIMIHIPPLRDRKKDIEPLINFFVQHISDRCAIKPPVIHKNVFQQLKNYSFPGNVRELRNMIERAMLFVKNNELNISHFNMKPMKNSVNNKLANLKLEDNEKKLISYALVQSNNNNSQAAKLLGISRDTLIRKKRKYNINLANNNTSNGISSWIG